MRKGTCSTSRCPTPYALGELALRRRHRQRPKRFGRIALAAVAIAVATGGCSPGDQASAAGSRDADGTRSAASEPAQPDGRHAYVIRCAYCHDVPNGIGAALGAPVLAAYGTVGQLDRYIRFAMPHEAPGSLASAEYDAILAYLVDSRGLISGGGSDVPLDDSLTLRTP